MAILEEKAEERKYRKKKKSKMHKLFEQIHGKSFELKVKAGSGDRLLVA